MNWLGKLELGLLAIIGYLYKLLIDIHVLKIPCLNNEGGADVIVSLTSYGRRVKTNVVYYTLVSLLRQKVQPSKIVLWLAEDEWNDNNIPDKLSSLKEKGIEISYCKDIRSYKKLIPTFTKYPGSNVMTVDDDVIYSSDTLSTMLNTHNNYKEDILCYVSRNPDIIDGLPQGYGHWKEFMRNEEGYLLFPVGYGGTFYPKGALHEDVCDERLFMSLCPMADDVWFWFCGIRNKTYKRCIAKKGIDLSFDSLYQYFHKGSALTHSNNQNNQNDVQIRKLFDYYNFRLKFRKLIKSEYIGAKKALDSCICRKK